MSFDELDLELPEQTRRRLSRPRLYMEAATLYSRRSSCLRAHVGVVAVRDGRIIAAGYAGAPAGERECMLDGCIIENEHCTRSVHAEANLIAWAARTGTALEGTDIYCTHYPCLTCAKLLHNAGVDSVVWLYPYESQSDRDRERVYDLINVVEYGYLEPRR
jgi:dCMP deaminase